MHSITNIILSKVYPRIIQSFIQDVIKSLYRKPQTGTISVILIMYEEKYPFFFGQKDNCKYYICRKGGRNRMIDADETGRYKKRTDSDISKTENDLINKIIIVILFSIMFVGDIILMYLAYVK